VIVGIKKEHPSQVIPEKRRSNKLSSERNNTIMTTWTNEDTFKLFLFSIFILSFVMAIRGLLNAEKVAVENAKKRGEKKDS
jgi:hypothetical protein